MWRAKGRVGMEAHVNLMFDLRDYLVQLIHEKQGFQMVFEEVRETLSQKLSGKRANFMGLKSTKMQLVQEELPLCRVIVCF